MSRALRRVAGAGLLALACLPPLAPAVADPWIPPAGSGVAKPMLRYFSGDTGFPANSFSSRTSPASKQDVIQFRIAGTLGLGHDLSLEYDLRGARVWESHTKHNHTITSTASGLQDQEVGLNYGLTQRKDFAQSIELNMVAPTGRSVPSPGLGSGRWAVEPDYQLGVKQGPFSATLIVGPRIFLDGNATQFRTTLDVAVHVAPRLTLSSEVFFVRTVQQAHVLPPGAGGELYNLLRLGVAAEYRLTRRLRPFVAYERNLAGQNIHAGNRFILGVAIHF